MEEFRSRGTLGKGPVKKSKENIERLEVGSMTQNRLESFKLLVKIWDNEKSLF